MAVTNSTNSEFIVIRKSELDELIRQLDYIHTALDFLLERQEARRELSELLPYDWAKQEFLIRQRPAPRKGGEE